MAAPKPAFVPRQSSGYHSPRKEYDEKRPPAATFEPERWSKAWKVGKDGKQEGSAVYSWSPKPKKFVEGMKDAGKAAITDLKNLLPAKKVGKVKRWGGDNSWQPLREGEKRNPGDKVHWNDGRMTQEELPKSTHTRPGKIISGAADFSKKK